MNYLLKMVVFHSFFVCLPEGLKNGYIMDISCNVRPPATIAKLVHITPITMVYGTYNYSYWGL